MHNDSTLVWLALARARLPDARKQQIAAHLPAPGTSGPGVCGGVSAIPDELGSCVDDDLERRLDRDLHSLASGGLSLVTLACPGYPALLKQITQPPVVLFVRGSGQALSRAQIAVVGSRNATHQGLETAHEFASHLSRCGFAITSGLARGIDGAAHAGCLAAGGCTVAVAATGPERVYPLGHTALAERIVDDGGAVVTEFPPGEPPRARNFPRRNRIISGLCLGTLVVEAAPRSGSLITARFALEQGREVFAIPGSIHNPAARGCHRLIRQGAKLVEQVIDIIEEFEWLDQGRVVADDPTPAVESAPGLDGPKAQVYDAVDHAPTDFDKVVHRTGLGALEVSSALLELELLGLVCKSAGFFSRRGGGH